jgi:hypothetical protein
VSSSEAEDTVGRVGDRLWLLRPRQAEAASIKERAARIARFRRKGAGLNLVPPDPSPLGERPSPTELDDEGEAKQLNRRMAHIMIGEANLSTPARCCLVREPSAGTLIGDADAKPRLRREARAARSPRVDVSAC